MRTLHRRNGFYTKLYHYNEIFYLLTLTPPLNINLSENFLRFYIFHLKKAKGTPKENKNVIFSTPIEYDCRGKKNVFIEQ